MIYLDNAATTKTAPEVVEAMLPFFSEYYGNASSIYTLGSASKKALNRARRTLADYLGAKQEEIYFTAGGSEADNWALKAAAEAYREKGKHIITTRIEHHAVLHTCEYLEKQGYEVTYIGVDKNGVVKLEELEAAIRRDTRHVLGGPCEDVAILTEEIDELAFLFVVKASAYDSVPLRVLWVQRYLLCFLGRLE